MRQLTWRCTISAITAVMLFTQSTQNFAAAADEKAADAGTVAVFNISGGVTEKPGDEELAIFTGQSADSFLSLTTRMRKTIDDDDGNF